MSIALVIRCNECDDQAENWLSTTPEMARAAAANSGWVHVGRSDYCPACATTPKAQLHAQRARESAERRGVGR